MTCPAPASLHQFLSGSLPAATADSMREHVRDCPRCQDALDRIYSIALRYGQLAAAVGNDQALTPARRETLVEQYEAHAVELLRRAWLGKYFAAPSTRYLLVDERLLAPLRGRADFRALLAEEDSALRARAFPK